MTPTLKDTDAHPQEIFELFEALKTAEERAYTENNIIYVYSPHGIRWFTSNSMETVRDAYGVSDDLEQMPLTIICIIPLKVYTQQELIP